MIICDSGFINPLIGIYAWTNAFVNYSSCCHGYNPGSECFNFVYLGIILNNYNKVYKLTWLACKFKLIFINGRENRIFLIAEYFY